MKILEVQGLHCGYGQTEIVSGVSFEVASGECLGLIGPNGHGKTTILRAVSGVVPSWAGSIHFDGKPLGRLSPHRIARLGVGHVPQGDMLFSDLTVEDNLAAALYGTGRWSDRRRLIDEVYEVFPRLQERRKQLALTLSGGEKRMLALGRGLSMGAKLLMIDEPSLGLAPRVIAEVYDRVRHLHERGLSMIVVEENPVRLRGIADHLSLVDTGRIIESGPTEEMLEHRQVLETYLGFSGEGAQVGNLGEEDQ
ncbi:MAG: ABC transporter ATP-binding protein [bacterium]